MWQKHILTPARSSRHTYHLHTPSCCLGSSIHTLTHSQQTAYTGNEANPSPGTCTHLTEPHARTHTAGIVTFTAHLLSLWHPCLLDTVAAVMKAHILAHMCTHPRMHACQLIHKHNMQDQRHAEKKGLFVLVLFVFWSSPTPCVYSCLVSSFHSMSLFLTLIH